MLRRWVLGAVVAGCSPAEEAAPTPAPSEVPVDTSVVPGDADVGGPEDDGAADTSAPADPVADDDPPAPPGPATLTSCFGDLWDGPAPVDYASAGATLGSHCAGTNHQDIAGVQRVVFIGDSIAQGTPPSPPPGWFRNRVAGALARQWGLAAPSAQWKLVDPISGDALQTFSGDFANCAKWGARTDDLIDKPHEQIIRCNPEEERDKVTLIVISIGGNDIFSLLEDINAGVDDDTLRETYDKAVSRFEDAIRWVKEPGRFPNGVFVVFNNTYDFTDPDGAEDMAACDGAQLIGLDAPLREPILHEILADAQARYLKLAVETGTDMVFFGEHMCGHGWNADDPTRRCYRGPGTPVWTDFTCEHPNAAGDEAIAKLILDVIAE